MRKIFLLLVLLSCSAHATIYTWAGTDGVGKWSTAANWGGTAPSTTSDTALFTNASVFPCTVDVDIAIARIHIQANNSGAFIATGKSMSFVNGGIDSGTGIKNYGAKLALTGDTATWMQSAGSGTVSSANCTLSVSGTGVTVTRNKSGSLRFVRVDASKGLTLAGTPVTTVGSEAATPALTIGASGSFTNNNGLQINSEHASAIGWSIGASATWNGSGNITIRPNNGTVIVLPKVTYTGTGSWSISSGGATSFPMNTTLSGDMNLNSRPLTVNISHTGITQYFRSAGYAITCGVFTTGNSSTNGTQIFSLKNSTLNCTDFKLSENGGGATIDSLFGSTINASGSLLIVANHTVVAGTSKINKTGATSTKTTLLNKLIFDMEIAKTGNVKDSLAAGEIDTMNNLTISGGGMYQPATTELIIKGNYSRTSTDSNMMLGQKRIWGDWTLGAGAGPNKFSDTTLTILENTGNSVVTLNGAFVGRTRIKKSVATATATFADAGRCRTLIDSVGILRFPNAVTFTVDSIFSLNDSVYSASGATIVDSGSLIMGANAKPNLLGTISLLGSKAQAITGIGSKSFGRVVQNKPANGSTVTGASRFSHLTITDGTFYGDTVYVTDTVEFNGTDSIYAPVVRLTTSRAKFKIQETTAKNGIAKIIVDSCGATVVNNATFKTPIYYPKVGPFVLSPASQTCTTGVAISSMIVVNSGCPADSFNAPTLPSGITINKTSGLITGTPLIPTATSTGYVYGYNSEGTKKDSTLWTFIIIKLKKATGIRGLSTSNGLIIGTD